MSQPLVSVIIPTFNRAGMMIQAIESIAAQKYPHIEIIVINNASRDQTSAVLNHISNKSMTIINNKFNIPVEVGVFEAARSAAGEYLIVLCDDDLISDHYIAAMVSAFESDRSVKVGLGRRVIIDADSKVLHTSPPLSDRPCAADAGAWLTDYFDSRSAHMQINNVFSCFYRRSDWLRVGGMPALSSGFFTDTVPFIAVCEDNAKIFFSPQDYFFYRMHAGQDSRQLPARARQSFLGLYQFFAHVRPFLRQHSNRDNLSRALIKYILMMFFGSCSDYAREEGIDPVVLQEFFADSLLRQG